MLWPLPMMFIQEEQMKAKLLQIEHQYRIIENLGREKLGTVHFERKAPFVMMIRRKMTG